MKYHEIDQPVSTLRRKLMLAFPGALAATTPLAILGCGGGGSGESQDAATDTGSLHDSGRAFAGSLSLVETSVAIDVPAGVLVPAGGLSTYTALGGFSSVQSGRAIVRQAWSTPQWTTLLTAEGVPLLFGFIGGGMATLSAHSTATALLAFILGSELSEGTTRLAWIEELNASPVTATFAQAIAAALVVDPYALAEGSSVIASAAIAAVRGLMPAMATASERARAMGLTINPPDAASGLQPITGQTANTVYVQNEKLRRAYHVIRREAYVDAAGATVADTARPVIASGDIPMLPGFDSAGSIIGSVTLAHFSNDPTGLAYSKTPEVTLPVTPDTAKRTVYSVTVLTAGNASLSYDPQAYAKLTDDEKKKIDITLFAPENLTLRQLFLDLLVPLFLSWLGGKIGDERDTLGPRAHKEKVETAVFGAILGLFQSTLPVIAGKMRDPKNYPNYGIGGALIDIVRNHLVDLVEVPVPGRSKPLSVPALSKFSIGMLVILAKYLAYEKMKNADGEALLVFLEGKGNPTGGPNFSWQPSKNGGPPTPVWVGAGDVRFAGMGVATKMLALVDDSLSLLSQTRLLADMATSRLLERWEVKSNKAKVKLSPDPLEVPVGFGVKATVTASIVDNDDDDFGKELGPITYDWTCTGRWGSLISTSSSGEPNRFTSSKDTPSADYFQSGDEPDAAALDEITVVAFFGGLNDPKRTRIGSVTVPVKVKKAFNLSISPASGAEVPSDTEFPVTAFVKETLPEGTTVDWTWSHAGVGAIAATPPDANPKDSSVNFNSGSTEGTATTTVRATLHLPASSTAPPRVITTDPVSASLNVKKGLRTITMEVSGGVFGCTDPRACGVSEYTAFVVPRLAKAVSYTAVLSGYAYPSCNRSVTWSSVKGDGGGCSFPVTYYPHSSAGATNAWAVWIGFGGAFSGKCVVTITLAL